MVGLGMRDTEESILREVCLQQSGFIPVNLV